MKLFGEYLVEKGLVKEEDLLACLIDQVASLPSICEIAYRLKLIQPTHFLKALSYQAIHQVEFKRACQELGIWTETINNAVERELQRQRMPIGQVLVKRGVVAFDVLTAALEDYLNTLAPISISGETEEAVPESKTSPIAAGLNFEPHFYFVEHEVLVDYLEQLSEEKRNRMESLIPEKGPITDKLLVQMRSEYHAIRGSAHFIKAHLSEHLVHQMGAFLGLSLRLSDQLTVADFDNLRKWNRAVLDMVWELRGSLEFSGSEGTLWKNKEFQTQFVSTHQALDMAIKKHLSIPKKKKAG